VEGLPDSSRGFTPRLLPLHVAVERPFQFGGGQGLVYARATRWQVLQASDSFITSPYERSPQLGVSWLGGNLAGWQYALEAEYNRFTLPHDQQATTAACRATRTPAGLAQPPAARAGLVAGAQALAQRGFLQRGSVAAAGAGSRRA
jgi:hypothetical protein